MLENRVYAWLCRKARDGEVRRIQAKPALAKLGTDVSEDPLEIRKALMALRAEGKVEYSAGPHGEPVSAFITVFPPKRELPAYVATWNNVLEASSLSKESRLALKSVGTALDGFAKADMQRLLAGLVRLRDEQTQMHGQCDFNVSAAYLLGSSKLLSALDSRALQAFGIAVDRFPARAPYVVVGGNTDSPIAVVLVENPIPFETAITSAAAERCLFACTFGFGLSVAANDYGNQLAGVIESGRAVVLNRSGGPAITIEQVLGHRTVHFWGDLDIAGMQIYQRLASQISGLRLSALYGPMIDAIANPTKRHPYVAAVGNKDGQMRMAPQCPDAEARNLLAVCQQFAVDQEIVTADQIAVLAENQLRHIEQ